MPWMGSTIVVGQLRSERKHGLFLTFPRADIGQSLACHM